MQPALIELYIVEMLKLYFEELADKFPMSPLNAILTNHLFLPEPGSKVSRLHEASAKLYHQIKLLEGLPDEQAIVLVDKDGKEEDYAEGHRVDVV